MDEVSVEFLLKEAKPIFDEHFPDVEFEAEKSNGQPPCLKMACVFRVFVSEEFTTFYVACNGYGIFVNKYATYGTERVDFPIEDPFCFEKIVAWINNKLATIDAEIIEKGIFHCGLLTARRALLESLEPPGIKT